ncbi:MAG: nuclear transport factor 2 family protein [Sphingopyxis sp.]
MMACPIEDRLAIEDRMVAYCTAVDAMEKPENIAALFTTDADFDLSGIGMARASGRDGIRDFFAGVFSAMSHHAHYLTNFALTDYDGETASARAYIIGMGRMRDGGEVTVHGRYYFNFRRVDGQWLASRYSMDFMMPLPGTLGAVQGG